MPGGGLQNMMGGIEPMQVGTNLFRWLFKSIQVDMPEENDNEGGLEEGGASSVGKASTPDPSEGAPSSL